MTAVPLTDLSNPAIAYERYLVEPLFRPFALLLVELTDAVPGNRVLDVATGTGIVARLAAQRIGNTRDVVGVDLSRGMMDLARKLEPGITWREGSASHLPLEPGETFDVVLCNHALQFFPDRALALRQMHAALAPGGRVGITTWSPVTSGLLHDLHLIAETYLGPIIDRRHAFGEPGPMRELLTNSGFHDLTIETVTRRVSFPDPSAFLQLNSRALVGMSMRAGLLSEPSRTHFTDTLIAASAEALRIHTTEDGLTFNISALVVTARA